MIKDTLPKNISDRIISCEINKGVGSCVILGDDIPVVGSQIKIRGFDYTVKFIERFIEWSSLGSSHPDYKKTTVYIELKGRKNREEQKCY